MDRDQIIKMALELGTRIAECSEWQALQETRDKVKQNSESWDLLLGYQEARARLAEKNQKGLTITEADDQELQTIEDKLRENALIKEMITAQENFNNLMQAIYFCVNQGMSGAASSCGDGRGCSSCGGSCS